MGNVEELGTGTFSLDSKSSVYSLTAKVPSPRAVYNCRAVATSKKDVETLLIGGHNLPPLV